MKPLSHAMLVALLSMASTVQSADSTKTKTTYEANGNVLGDDVLYSIGGGSAVSMSGAADMRSIGIGVGWNRNLICANMDLNATLQNQLNGVTNGFQSIMSSVIQSATSAVASLPAMIIQRADPALGQSTAGQNTDAVAAKKTVGARARQ
ncbi:hypothetical protein D3C81_1196350 [compost metagenome]